MNAALIAYLALFPAVFAMVMRRLLAAHGRDGHAVGAVCLDRDRAWRTHLFTGFPWVLLGYSQVTVLPIAQLASLVGVFGAVRARRRRRARRSPSPAVSSFNCVRRPAIVLRRDGCVARHTCHSRRSRRSSLPSRRGAALRVKRSELTRQGDVVRIGLVQGNVGAERARGSCAAAGDLPELSPDDATGDRRRRRARAVAGVVDAVLLRGGSSRAPTRCARWRGRRTCRFCSEAIRSGGKRGTASACRTKYYNSAFLVRADGTTAGFYRKMHLVPFGEDVPLKQLFFFAAPLVQAVSDSRPARARRCSRSG